MHAFIQQMLTENLLDTKCQATVVALVLMGETARVSEQGLLSTAWGDHLSEGDTEKGKDNCVESGL